MLLCTVIAEVKVAGGPAKEPSLFVFERLLTVVAVEVDPFDSEDSTLVFGPQKHTMAFVAGYDEFFRALLSFSFCSFLKLFVQSSHLFS